MSKPINVTEADFEELVENSPEYTHSQMIVYTTALSFSSKCCLPTAPTI